jgi:formimidoylglutamate deiminase
MPERKLRLPCALLPEGFADDVVIEIDEAGFISSVTKEVAAGEAPSVDGIAIPGLANVHSHAHQRAMAGLAEICGPGEDSFWTWREAMYRFALKIGPDELQAIAAQLYVEALKAGFTCIGEFQYLHHAPGGRPYDNPAELSLRCVEGAATAGIAITILPTLYSFGGFGAQPPHEGQRRFIKDKAGFLTIVAQLKKAIWGRAGTLTGRRVRCSSR